MCGCGDREVCAETTDKPNLVQPGHRRPTAWRSAAWAHGWSFPVAERCASTSAATIRWAAARDRERGQSARDDRDRQTASDTLTASGDVVHYVRCSDRDGTDDEGRAERDRSWNPPGRGAAGANQRSSASTNP